MEIISENKASARETLLSAAADLIFEKGVYQTSLEEILTQADLTKGAFYYYFKSKKALVLAIINETLRETIHTDWVTPIKEHFQVNTVIDSIILTLQERRAQRREGDICRGCPINNLTQELSNTDDDLCKAIQSIHEEWRTEFAKIIFEAQSRGEIIKEFTAKQISTAVIAFLEGLAGLAKNEKSTTILDQSFPVLLHFLKSFTSKGEIKNERQVNNSIS